MEASTDKPTVLRTVRQMAEKHEAFTEGALRHYIHNAKPRYSTRGVIPGNGLESALVRIGRKVLIDEAGFFQWVRAQSIVSRGDTLQAGK